MDIEVRAFGRRFLLVWQKQDPTSAPTVGAVNTTSGSFESVAANPYYDDNDVVLRNRFGFRA